MIDFKAASPARYKQSILLCTDAGYEKFAFALVKSIVDAEPDLAADICLVSEHQIDVPQSLSHLPVRLGRISIDKQGIAFPQIGYVTFASYVRLFSFSALADTYDRILYLDSDILIENAGLSELLSINLLDGHAVGAVRDRPQQLDMGKLPDDAVNMGIPYFPYFNSGMLLVDTQRWQDQNILPRILDMIRENSHAFTHNDQSALNLVLRGSWSELSWKWNFIFIKEVFYQYVLVRPTVIHFAGRAKPWFVNAQIVPRHFPMTYSAFLAEHYPEALKQGVLPAGRRKRFYLLRVLVANLRVMRRLRAYRLRFRDHMVAQDPWSY
jgi:lipopolysaccharide biosynthesis glycosyltransferase